MVSAPDTKSTSVQAIPASRMASRAACTPYSTKLRPHLPHGCMPAPSTATRLLTGLPLPDEVVGVVLGVEHIEHELDGHADAQIVDGDAVHDLTHDDELLRVELHCRD